MGPVFRFLSFLGWGMYNTCTCMVNMKQNYPRGFTDMLRKWTERRTDKQTYGRVEVIYPRPNYICCVGDKTLDMSVKRYDKKIKRTPLCIWDLLYLIDCKSAFSPTKPALTERWPSHITGPVTKWQRITWLLSEWINNRVCQLMFHMLPVLMQRSLIVNCRNDGNEPCTWSFKVPLFRVELTSFQFLRWIFAGMTKTRVKLHLN